MRVAEIQRAVVRGEVRARVRVGQRTLDDVRALLQLLDAEVIRVELSEVVEARVRLAQGWGGIEGHLGPVTTGGGIDLVWLEAAPARPFTERLVTFRRRTAQADFIAEAHHADVFQLLAVLLHLLKMLGELRRHHAPHVNVGGGTTGSGLGVLGPHIQREQPQKLLACGGVFRVAGPLVKGVAVDQRALRRLAAHGALLEIREHLIEQRVRGADPARVARVGVVGDFQRVGVALEFRHRLQLARRILHTELQAVMHRRALGLRRGVEAPLTVVERVQQAADFLPLRDRTGLGGERLRLPRALVNPIRRVLDARRHRERGRRGGEVVKLEEDVARLREQTIERQIILLRNARFHTRLVLGEHEHIHMASRGWFGLVLGDQRELRAARGEFHPRVVAFPHRVFHRTPVPADFGLHALAEGPDFRVFPRSVNPVELHLPALLDPQPEPRLKTERGLVTRQCEILSGRRHFDLHRRFGAGALLGRAETALAAEEGIGE